MVLNFIELIAPLKKIALTLIVLLVVFVSVRIITYCLKKIKRFKNIDMTLVYLTRDLIQYLIYFIAILVIFNIYGIDLKAIFISVGIVGIAISFAAKDMLANFFAGVSLIADKTIKVGDTLEIDGQKGIISKMSFRNTTIVDDLGVIITIPNSRLTDNPYLKYKPTEHYRIDIITILPIYYDLKTFEDSFKNIISKFDWIEKNPKASIFAKEITEDGTKLKISVWINEYSQKDNYKIILTNEIRKIIYNYEAY